jgi:hypothetical protein
LHFFHEKRKKQSIPLPWRIGEILLRGISKIDEFVDQLHQYNFKFTEEIKGFDPKHLFVGHMTLIGFSNSLTNTFIFGEEEGESHDPLTQYVEKRTNYIETIVSTTNRYKQKGKVLNKKGSQPPIVSQKNGPPKNNFQSETSQQKKSSTNKSGDGGDKNTPRGRLEKPHKLQVKIKRTNSH